MKNAQKKDFLPEEFSVPAATFARNKITLLNLRVPRTEMAFQKPSKPSYQKWQNTVLVERDAEVKNLKMVAKVSPREPLEHEVAAHVLAKRLLLGFISLGVCLAAGCSTLL